MNLPAPGPGEDSRDLWRYVAELVAACNALMNMTVLFDGQIRLIGKLEMREGSCVLHINSNTEVGSLGT